MLKLTMITAILIASIGLVFNLNSTDLCYSQKDSLCRGNHSYQCGKHFCSFDKETCESYNKHKRSFVFRSLFPLIQFQKEIKACDLIESEIIDLNSKFCLNRHDCLETSKLVIYGITVKNEIKQVDCKCKGDMKYECNRNYCTNNLDSCEIINHKLLNQIKVKDCDNTKIHTVIIRKGRSKY